MIINVMLYTLVNLCISGQVQAPAQESAPAKKIVIEVTLPKGYQQKQETIHTIPVVNINTGPTAHELIAANHSLKWQIFSREELYFTPSFIPYDRSYVGYMVEPGDSVHIDLTRGSPSFSGKGFKKFELIQRLQQIEDSLRLLPLYKSLTHSAKPLSSLSDFFNWNRFLNIKTSLIQSTLDQYKPMLSPFIYESIKIQLLSSYEKQRHMRFLALRRQGQELGLSNKDMCAIYDTVMNNISSKWLRYQASHANSPYYLSYMLRHDEYRKTGSFYYNGNPVAAMNLEDKCIQQYYSAKNTYKGMIREAVMAYIFYDSDGIFDAGFSPKVEALLEDYYASATSVKHKEVVRAYELQRRERGAQLYASSLTGVTDQGDVFTLESLRGKIVVLDFWFTGCVGCIQMATALRTLEKKFKADSNIVFVSVSIDKNKAQWLKSIRQRVYTSGEGIQINIGLTTGKDSITRKYGVESYPTLFLVDGKGRIIPYDKRSCDPRSDQGRKLTGVLKRYLALEKDGPYVITESGGRNAYYVIGKGAISRPVNLTTMKLPVHTDSNSTFNIETKRQLSNEPCIFDRPQKIFVLSDIEGNFTAFRSLLQHNRIIDNQFRWIFGQGHLVFAGDMFDRGNQVTECLWLIYSLEEQAKKAGGYVHFILGNHEVMNLQGNHKYVDDKYRHTASILERPLQDLYGTQTELGRWLRTKNVMERIGDILFVHGGISRKINALGISLTQLNEGAKPFYADTSKITLSPISTSILSSSTGPLWYRGYYDRSGLEGVVDSALQHFAAKRIVTGHTIVADTISVHYCGKVINTDTKHANGKSEALLIEGTKFYRVNDKGQSWLLFNEADRQKTPL